MVTNPKLNPHIYLKSCEVLGINPENSIVIEDSDLGIKATFDAGMKTILIPDIKELSEETITIAYKKLDSLLDVINLLKSEFKL